MSESLEVPRRVERPRPERGEILQRVVAVTGTLAAEDPGVVSGLLLLSYPLHPPRQPSQQRTAHFPSLRTPALFVQGTRDPFGSVEEMRLALQLILARTSLLALDGAGHDLLSGRRTRRGADIVNEIPRRLLGAFCVFFEPETSSAGR